MTVNTTQNNQFWRRLIYQRACCCPGSIAATMAEGLRGRRWWPVRAVADDAAALV